MAGDLSRLSLNQATTKHWSLREAVDGCVRAGIPAIGVWRDRLAETGVAAAARLLRDAGLHCSSLCRGGWFPAATRAERAASHRRQPARHRRSCDAERRCSGAGVRSGTRSRHPRSADDGRRRDRCHPARRDAARRHPGH